MKIMATKGEKVIARKIRREDLKGNETKRSGIKMICCTKMGILGDPGRGGDRGMGCTCTCFLLSTH